MNSFSKNIKSVGRLTTMVSEDSQNLSTFTNKFHKNVYRNRQMKVKQNKNPFFVHSSCECESKSSQSKQIQQFCKIIKMIEQQLSSEREARQKLQKQVQKTKHRQEAILQEYKKQVQRQFEKALNNVLKDEQERIQSIENFYRQKVAELEHQNCKYKYDYQTMKVSLQNIEEQFNTYSKKHIRIEPR